MVSSQRGATFSVWVGMINVGTSSTNQTNAAYMNKLQKGDSQILFFRFWFLYPKLYFSNRRGHTRSYRKKYNHLPRVMIDIEGPLRLVSISPIGDVHNDARALLGI
jgi:hypothetical protein